MPKSVRTFSTSDSSRTLLLLFSCLVSGLFFLAGFGFYRFNVDLPFYLSEIVCSGPSKVKNCRDGVVSSGIVFQSSPTGATILQDFGVRYTSATFATFLNLFSNAEDTVATLITKIYAVKSVIVTFFVTVSIYFARRCYYVYRITLESIICTFALPYSLFGAASEYPAVIATIATLPILISLNIYRCEPTISSKFHLLLATTCIFACSVVMANRFETTVFCGIAFLIHAWQCHRKGQVHRGAIPLLMYLTLLVIFISRNDALKYWFRKIVLFDASILNDETVQTSKLVQAIGDSGLSVGAVITLFDNTSRTVTSALDSSVHSGMQSLLIRVVVLVSWIPLVLIVSNKLYLLLRAMVKQKRELRAFASEYLPALFVIILFFLIPAIARVIWFFQYANPLILVFLFVIPTFEGNSISLKPLLLIGLFSNTVAYFSVFTQSGSLYLGHIVIGSRWIVVTGLVSLIMSFTICSMYLRESNPQEKEIHDLR